MIEIELGAVMAETKTQSTNARRLMSAEIRRLCTVGVLERISPKSFRYREIASPAPLQRGTKGVLALSVEAALLDNPAERYLFGAADLPVMTKLIGSAILYQLGRGRYYAVAKVESIIPGPTNGLAYFACIEPGSFLEFGRHVPVQIDGRLIERSLQHPNGRIDTARASQAIRLIADDDFFRVLDLVEPEAALTAVPSAIHPDNRLLEERRPFHDAADRLTELTRRSARDRQFRKRVIKIYHSKCAVSGSMLIDLNGEVEVQAAHIKSVEARGPDCTTNGVALSATVHWAFDRGYLSFTDEGEILLSSQINDPDFVPGHIPDHRQAAFPQVALCRPDPQYLQWHREHCFQP